MKVLVIAAHPDDEVLGCGGTMAKLARQGTEISVAILGEGATSRYQNRHMAGSAEVEELQEDSKKVADLLGVENLFLGNLPDNRFDTLPLLDVVKMIENYAEQTKPDVVYTQHGGDLNIDHQITFRATLTAFRPQSGKKVRSLYAYEVPSSTDWAFGQFAPQFNPNVFVDISASLSIKLKAMEMYESEVRCFPHPRSEQALRATALRWGSVSGLEAAEAFELIYGVQ